MKFKKIKLKRCKDCAYYKKIGGLHFCTNNRFSKEFGTEILGTIPLICFKKYKIKRILVHHTGIIKENCTDKEWQHCRVEKRGCEGCHYDKEEGKNETDKKY